MAPFLMKREIRFHDVLFSYAQGQIFFSIPFLSFHHVIIIITTTTTIIIIIIIAVLSYTVTPICLEIL